MSERGDPPRSVPLEMDCSLDEACTYTYDDLEMRGDGDGFTLNFKPTAGFTYRFAAASRPGSEAGARLQLAIYPPDAIGGTSGAPPGGCAGSTPTTTSGGAADVGELRLGTFLSPPEGSGRQSWGDAACAGGNAGCCNDPTTVETAGGCGGTYRHFPGQRFGDSDEWEWTCPYTGKYIVQVTANCDIPYLADPGRPDCRGEAGAGDGVVCDDPATVEECHTGVYLTVSAVDRAVHIKRSFELPRSLCCGSSGRRALQGPDAPSYVPQAAFGGNDEMLARANLFRDDRQAGLAYPMSITQFRCSDPEHADRALCRAASGGGGTGGGHRRERRRRRLQAACPHSTFDTREASMRVACGLAGADSAELEAPSCPSAACAEQMTALQADCAESIDHLRDD